MSEYKGIKGYTVQKIGSDPTPADTLGQLFYNSADNEFHISAAGSGSWASGGNLNASRAGWPGGMGTTTAGAVVGGMTPPDVPSALVEEYNGTCWSEENDRPVAGRFNWTCGTVAAGLTATGGLQSAPWALNNVDEYDGTSWAAGGNYPAGFYYANGCGTQTAALGCQGFQAAVGYRDETFEYDGSSWAEAGDYPGPLGLGGTSGIQTSAMRIGGTPSPQGSKCNTYDGSSWAASPDLNVPRQQNGAAPNGTITATLAVGGAPNANPPVTVGRCEQWDGTSWAAVTQLTQGRSKVGSIGTNESYLAVGGDQGSPNLATELWDNSPIATKTITVS